MITWNFTAGVKMLSRAPDKVVKIDKWQRPGRLTVTS